MKTFSAIALLVLATASTAQAETYFEQVTKMFDEGTGVTEADIAGWHSGRCFWHDAQDKPRSSMLVSVIKESAEDPGPGLPRKKKIYLLTMARNNGVGSDTNPGEYDNPKPEELRSAENFLNRSVEMVVEETGPAENEWVTQMKTGNTYYYRKNKEYFVAMFVKPDGTHYASCYYFKKIKD